jgi:uncharacterized OsmC-like protein
LKIILLAEDTVRLEPEPGPMTIEALSADQLYSPFHMLASGLAFCTYSILASWADTAKLSADDCAIEVRWTFVEEPHRIGATTLTLDWPSLPAARTAAAKRVAELCPIHATLHHPPATTIERREAPAAAAAIGAPAAAVRA